jgi:hypothetical protein
LEHQETVRIAVIRIEGLINSPGVQETADILAEDEMGDDVVHFAGWGDFSLAKGCFLPIRADSIVESELMGLNENTSIAG